MNDSTVLNSKQIEGIFLDCLFRDGEDTAPHVRAEGIMATVDFHSERLESHRAEVEAMLAELPDDFRESGGGCASFLNLCMDRHGRQWTDLQLAMNQLLTLGIALGKVIYPLPREVWGALPGGMPYVTIKI